MKQDRNSDRRPIRLDDLPWDTFATDDELVALEGVQEGSDFKALIEPSTDKLFIYVRFPPHFVAPEHWHTSPTIYIITKGEFHVDGEGTYRAGDFRWVEGGFAYGAESAGEEGCEFYLGSLGPFGTFEPKFTPPPGGSWKDE
jgi:hypothetical protein